MNAGEKVRHAYAVHTPNAFERESWRELYWKIPKLRELFRKLPKLDALEDAESGTNNKQTVIG